MNLLATRHFLPCLYKTLPSMFESWLLIMIISLVKILLAIYLIQTPLSIKGYSQPFSYLFQSSYWFPKRTSDKSVLHKVTMSYDRDNTCALDQFDFEFHKGNVYVLLGEKGAGKSTLCEIVTGIFRPVSGTGTIIGYDLDSLINARQVLGVCTQHPTLIPDFTALEHVSFYVSFRDIQLQMSMTEYATQLLKKVNLEKHLREHVSQFSGGMQSRLNYILLTIGNSDLYLFDEPTAALDVVAKQDVWKSIQELKKDSIVILTTHDMEEAEYLADQVIVLNKGTLKEHDNVLELKKKYRNIGRLILSNAKMKLPTLDY